MTANEVELLHALENALSILADFTEDWVLPTSYQRDLDASKTIAAKYRAALEKLKTENAKLYKDYECNT